MNWQSIKSDKPPLDTVLIGRGINGEVFNFVATNDDPAYIEGTGPHYLLVRRHAEGGFRTVHHEGHGHSQGYPVGCSPTEWQPLTPKVRGPLEPLRPMTDAPRGESVWVLAKRRQEHGGYWDVVTCVRSSWFGVRSGRDDDDEAFEGWCALDATPNDFFNFDILN